MRRLIAVSILLLMLVSAAFCDTGDISSATSTFDFSAYKNPELPPLRYTITISNKINGTDNVITGTSQEYRINNYNNFNDKALHIKIDTNLYKDISVAIYLYPFINEYDPSDFFTATYYADFSKMSYTTVECQWDSVEYRYTAEWEFQGFIANGTTGYKITPLTGSGICGTITSKIIAQKKVDGVWVTADTVPTTDDVINGFGQNQYVTSTIQFRMKPNFGSPARTPEANMRYVAKIRLVISTV